VSWLVTESTGRRGVAGATSGGCRQCRATRGRVDIRTRATIDFFCLKHCFDLDLVEVSEQGEG